ncbi:MAG TPA: iron ABC transporter permease [Candidatus Binatia bacterium]
MDRLVRVRPKGRLPVYAARLTEHFGLHAVPLSVSGLVLVALTGLSLFVLYMTFVPGLPTEPGFTLDHWRTIARPYILTKVIPNTAIIGVGAVAISLLFGCPLAWILNRTSLPWRNTLVTLIAVSVVVPGFVKAMGWMMLLNERIGLINRAIAGVLGWESVTLSVNNIYGTAWLMGLMLTPTMFFLISGPIRAMDPTLEEAASISRAGRWQTLLRVTLPLMWPGILGGAIYVFMTAISVFEIPALLGGMGGQMPVLATELFYEIHPPSQTSIDIHYGAAGVYGALMAVPSLVGLYFYHHALGQGHRYEVITAKGYRPRLSDLGRYTPLALGFVLLYLLLATVLPMLVLIWASLLPYLQVPSLAALSKLSFANYTKFLPAMGGALIIRNTVILVVSVSVLVTLLSFMISWVVVRTKIRWRFAIDSVVLASHAIPSLAFAFALFMLSLIVIRWLPWLPFYGTLGIIILANILNRLPYATRITNAALLQVHHELEECARTCGGRPLTVMRRVVIPLVRPSLIFAALWTALLSFSEVSMALFLTSTQNKILSVGVWSLWATGYLSIASAAAVVTVAIMGTLVFITVGLGGQRVTSLQQTVTVAQR